MVLRLLAHVGCISESNNFHPAPQKSIERATNSRRGATGQQSASQWTDPGRYMFRFGWLTITADDLPVWHVSECRIHLISALAPPPAKGDEQPPGEESPTICDLK